MHAVASLDQGFDTVIVKLGPAAEHINHVDIGSVKMEAGAPFCLRALARGTDQLHTSWPLVAGVTPLSR
jgi:hypothetical protein